MARSKEEKSVIVIPLGVQMTIWQNLVNAVRKHGGNDEDIYRLGTSDGQPTIEAMAKLIVGKVGEAKMEMIAIAGYEFQQITYGDGSRLIELGEFEVDSDQSLASKLEVRGFIPHDQAKPGQDSYNSWINQERFPFQQKGRGKVRLALINTGKEVQYEADFVAMTKRVGRQMCDHAHGLTVEEKYPNLQRELYYIMFGARGLSQGGNPAVLMLSHCRDERLLEWCCLDDCWHDESWGLVAS